MKKGTCGRCGFPVSKSNALKSRHTQSIYCVDIGECDRRSKGNMTLVEMDLMLTSLREQLSG